jgi:hypothetical protein
MFIIEAKQVFDLWAFGDWRRTTPHDILEEPVDGFEDLMVA